MEKFKKTLEKNIEWIALGLAGLWVLSLVWMYVIHQRVFVEINGQTYSVSTVDDLVTTEAKQLLVSIISTTVPPNLGSVEPAVAVNLTTPVMGSTSGREWWSQPARNIQLPHDLMPPGALASKITALPEVPPIKLVEFQSDRDQVNQPKQEKLEPGKQGAAPAVAPASGIVPPTYSRPRGGTDYLAMRRYARPMGPGMPMSPMAPAAPGWALDPNATPVDKYWVTLFGKFSEADLDAAFQKAKIPPFLSRREYIAVQLVRQEQMPDGTWGNEKEIPPLPMNAPPFDKTKDTDNFLAWALAPDGQVLIVQPPFYQSLNNKWAGGPPVKAVLETIAAADFDPLAIAEQLHQMTPADQTKYYAANPGLTPDQKGKIYKAMQALKEKEAADKRQQKSSSKGAAGGDRGPIRLPPTPRGGAGVGAGGRDAQDPSVLREMYAQAASDPRNPTMPGYGRRPLPYGRPYAAPVAPGGVRPTFTLPPPRTAEPTQAIVVRPSDPVAGELTVVFDVWAHDETVEPGNTYRYKMRMRVKNPVYITNMAKDPALAKYLELPIDKDKSWSEWSKPIEVKPRVQIFLAGGAASNNSLVRFDVYRWQNGKVNKPAQAIAVTPGDMVGGPDKSGLDYTTGLTVVDIRTVGNDCRVTLVDENGAQKVRYFKSDSSDPSRKELEQQNAKEKAETDAAAAIGTGNTGTGNTPATGQGLPRPR